MDKMLKVRYIEEALKIDYENFQPCIKTVRNVLGYTAQEFGDKLGVTKQEISLWETKKARLTKIS